MKPLVLLVLLFCGVTATIGQTSIKEVISRMPEKILPYITDEQKTELLKFTDANNFVKVRNVFNGVTSIDTISLDYAKISMSETAEMQLKLLPTNDSVQILCVIKTIKSPLKESIIKFYSTNWQPLNSTFGIPKIIDSKAILSMFTHKPDSMTEDEFNNLYNYIDPVMLTANWENKDNSITLNLSIPFIQNKKHNDIKSIINEITFKWDGLRFKKY